MVQSFLPKQALFALLIGDFLILTVILYRPCRVSHAANGVRMYRLADERRMRPQWRVTEIKIWYYQPDFTSSFALDFARVRC
jgi:hypothetical protein